MLAGEVAKSASSLSGAAPRLLVEARAAGERQRERPAQDNAERVTALYAHRDDTCARGTYSDCHAIAATFGAAATNMPHSAKTIARAQDGPRHRNGSASGVKRRRRISRNARAAAGGRAACAARTSTGDDTRLHRQQAFALHLLARELAGAADRFGLFARLFSDGFS